MNNSVKKKYRDENFNITELHKLCSELSNLVVSLYNIEKQEFEYCSQSVKKVLGYHPEAVTESGWDFWYSLLKPIELPVVRQKLTNSIFDNSAQSDTYSLAYHIKKPCGDWISVKHEIYHKRFAEKGIALNILYDNSERELIKSYLDISQQYDFGVNGNDDAKDINDITGREKQVLKLIACGLSSKEIAKKLYISRHTVISHRKNLIEKFKAKNTAELIKKASKVINL